MLNSPKPLEDCIVGICKSCEVVLVPLFLVTCRSTLIVDVSSVRLPTADKGCRSCNSTKVRWMYRVVLQLDDGTGSLMAGLIEDDIVRVIRFPASFSQPTT